MPALVIKQHAIDRYRERCAGAASLPDKEIVETLRRMAENPDSVKIVKHGQFMVCGEWVLIRAENSIITVYQGDVKSILRKKINPRKAKHDAPAIEIDDDPSAIKRRRKTDR